MERIFEAPRLQILPWRLSWPCPESLHPRRLRPVGRPEPGLPSPSTGNYEGVYGGAADAHLPAEPRHRDEILGSSRNRVAPRAENFWTLRAGCFRAAAAGRTGVVGILTRWLEDTVEGRGPAAPNTPGRPARSSRCAASADDRGRPPATAARKCHNASDARAEAHPAQAGGLTSETNARRKYRALPLREPPAAATAPVWPPPPSAEVSREGSGRLPRGALRTAWTGPAPDWRAPLLSLFALFPRLARRGHVRLLRPVPPGANRPARPEDQSLHSAWSRPRVWPEIHPLPEERVLSLLCLLRRCR